MNLKTITSFFSCLTLSLSAAPNVIVVLTDDLGFGDIYCLHQNKRDNGAGTGGIAGDGLINGTEEAFIYTPYIDRMAAEGSKLTRHYTSAPVCAPARGSLLQGRDQGHANIRDNSFDKVISDNHTLATVMDQAGYYTACVGKWGVGGSSAPYGGHPTDRGFDYFYGLMEHIDGHHHYPGNAGTVFENKTSVTTGLDHAYTTDLWTAKAKSIIQDRATNHPSSPFFIYLAYDAPHAVLEVPTQAYPAGLGTSGGLTWPLNTNSGTNDSYIHPDYSALSNAASRHATMVRRLDTAMGDILQTLRDLNIDDNTLVIFTSDNGTHNEAGAGGSVAHDPRNFDSYGELEGIKRDHLEGGIRMPTFAWWPTQIGDNNAATAGLDSTRPSGFWDWMPTIIDAAGITPPAWTSGVSLLPELTGSGTQQDKGYLYFEYNFGGNTPNYADFPNHGGDPRGQMQTIFLDDGGIRYKGIRTGISSHTDDFQIYDVDNDINESTNLASSLTDLQQRMKDKVLQVRIDGDYSRSYMSSEFAAPATPAATVNGLDYKAFTGTWDWVPETDYLTPVASGESTNIDLSKRTTEDNIALEFTGYVSVPTDGTYTFLMTTDSTVSSNSSGGMLWIHDAHIIDDDFNHTGAAQSGTMRLKAGKHPIRVLYKHATGTHDINLQYSGPGIALQTIPDSSFFRDGIAPPEPVANPDSASASATTTVSIPVLLNDSDDGLPSTLSIQSVSSPGFGSAVINGSNIDYTAEVGKYGNDQFSYTITDGQHTATAIVTVNVLVPNQASTLLHTGFSGVSEGSGPTAFGFSWTSDESEEANATTSLTFTGSASGFIAESAGAAEAGEPIGISGNIETSSSWSTSFSFTPSASYDISSFDISSYSISSSGVHQGAPHDVAWTLNISDGTSIFTGSDQHTEPSGSAAASFSIDTSGTTLNAGTTYTFNLTVSAPNGGGGNNIALNSLTLNQSPHPKTDRATWYYLHFGIAAPAPADWLADTDNDGSDQLTEYAFGGSPHSKNSSPSTPTSSYNDTSNKLEATFTRRKTGSHDLTYTAQVSDDLSDWTTLTASEISTSAHPTLGDDFEQVTVETDDTSSTHPKLFLRMQAQ